MEPSHLAQTCFPIAFKPPFLLPALACSSVNLSLACRHSEQRSFPCLCCRCSCRCRVEGKGREPPRSHSLQEWEIICKKRK